MSFCLNVKDSEHVHVTFWKVRELVEKLNLWFPDVETTMLQIFPCPRWAENPHMWKWIPQVLAQGKDSAKEMVPVLVYFQRCHCASLGGAIIANIKLNKDKK